MSSKPFLYSKILVVDDEVEVCDALKQFLEEEEFKVETANDGEGALIKMDEFRPQCILLDIRMPYLNGIDALKMIKFRQPETEVIMVTAVTNIKIAEECLRTGAFGFVTKPVDLDYLLKEVHAALHRRQETLEKAKPAPEHVDHLVEENRNFQAVIQTLNEDLISSLRFPMNLIEYSNPEFACHAKNVSWLARKLAEQLKAPQTRLCELAGLYHDIGKLCLPRLLWQGSVEKWTAAERRVYQRFPIYGQDIVQSHFNLGGLGMIIRRQCENPDGTGFPDQIPGFNVPLESKIVAVANAFDEAMIQLNRRNIEQDIAEGKKALEMVNLQMGKKFDPAVCEALAQLLKDYKYKGVKELELKVSDLAPRMVLSRNVATKSGKFVLSHGTTLTPTRIDKILDFSRIEAIAQPVYVYADSVSPPPDNLR